MDLKESRNPEGVKHTSEKQGLPPGSLTYVGERGSSNTIISVIDYDGDIFDEKLVETAEHCYPLKETNTVSWINVDGLKDVKIISMIGQHFGLDPLMLEDILNTEQRPKVEVFGDHFFFTLKMLSYHKKNRQIEAEQVSFVLGRNYVISFQEYPGDIFEPVRNRLRNKWGNIRYQHSDYLVYALIDVVVDNYFIILDSLGHEIEKIEDIVFEGQKRVEDPMKIIQQNKRQIQILQRSIHPLREAITKLQRNESNLIHKHTLKYFNDVRDHTIQVIENIDSYRDLNVSVQDVYLSSLSHKMNQVMQVLTIISTIFIPLTFISGVYGMNFKYMPELSSKFGYWSVLGIMGLISGIQLYFFRKKGWI